MSIIRNIQTLKESIFRTKRCTTFPIALHIEPTTFCNLNCASCPRAQIIKKPRFLETDFFKIIFVKIKPRYITMHGLGEPLLNPNIFEMISYASQRGAFVDLTTNGIILSEKTPNLRITGLHLLNVSLDATDKTMYQDIRGEDYFERILQGLYQFNKIRNNKKPYLRLSFVIQKRNLPYLKEAVKLAKEFNADIYFQFLELDSIEDKKDDLLGNVNLSDFVEQLKECYKASQAKGVRTNLYDIIHNSKLYWETMLENKETRVYRRCLFPWLSTYITSDGDVFPCCRFENNKYPPWGNLTKDDFANVWNSEKYISFRKNILSSRTNFERCRKCIPPGLFSSIFRKRLV